MIAFGEYWLADRGGRSLWTLIQCLSALFHESARMSIDPCTTADMLWIIVWMSLSPVLVGCAGLSLDAVLGVVRAYLPRLECSKVVGSDNLDLDSVSLVVQTDDL